MDHAGRCGAVQRNTGEPGLVAERTFVLTLALDDASFLRFNEERSRYFPPELNRVPAHVSLFHHLPGEHDAAIHHALSAAALEQDAMELLATGVRNLGRGAAYTFQSETLQKLRGRLRDSFAEWLTPQDKQGYRPHLTVQNKVDPEKARATLAVLGAQTFPIRLQGRGMLLWLYRNGWWELEREYGFGPPTRAA